MKKTIFMKTPLPERLQSCREIVSLRQSQENYILGNFLLRKITESFTKGTKYWQKVCLPKQTPKKISQNEKFTSSPYQIHKETLGLLVPSNHPIFYIPQESLDIPRQ